MMLVFGVVGYVLKKSNYPLAPMVLAIVLGDKAEEAFRQSLLSSQGSLGIFFSNGLVSSIMALGLDRAVLAADPERRCTAAGAPRPAHLARIARPASALDRYAGRLRTGRISGILYTSHEYMMTDHSGSAGVRGPLQAFLRRRGTRRRASRSSRSAARRASRTGPMRRSRTSSSRWTSIAAARTSGSTSGGSRSDFGISRTPVREAMAQLEREGFVRVGAAARRSTSCARPGAR